MKHRVLVTGSAGRLGRSAVAALTAQGHTVFGLDARPTPGLPTGHSLVASLADASVLQTVARDVDRILHLAATPDDAKFPRGTSPNDGDNFLNDLVPNNIVGLYRVLEAARAAKVPRIVLASTGQVVDRSIDGSQIPFNSQSRYVPRYLYACTKVFLEAIGQVYAREHGIEVVTVRLGWCPRDPGQVAEIAANPDHQDVYLSPKDAGRFFVSAIEATKLAKYNLVYATSHPLHRVIYDLTETTQLLGFRPQDRWPTDASNFG
jgi:uronate dehydrogenase